MDELSPNSTLSSSSLSPATPPHVIFRSPVGHTGASTEHTVAAAAERRENASTDLSSVRSDAATAGSEFDPASLGLQPLNLLLLETCKASDDDDHKVGRLLASGAHVDARDQRLGFKGFRPLHYAAKHGHAKIVDLLLESGASVNLLTEDAYNEGTDPRTPLDIAEEHAEVKFRLNYCLGKAHRGGLDRKHLFI